MIRGRPVGKKEASDGVGYDSMERSTQTDKIMPSKRLFWTSVVVAGIAVSSRASDAAGPDYLKVKDLTPVKVLAAPQHAPVVLVSDGQPKAKVYVAVDKPSATLDILVKELVTAVKLSTGAELEIVKKMPADHGYMVPTCRQS